MTLTQALLDRLWDFADPGGSEARLRAAAATTTERVHGTRFVSSLRSSLNDRNPPPGR